VHKDANITRNQYKYRKIKHQTDKTLLLLLLLLLLLIVNYSAGIKLTVYL